MSIEQTLQQRSGSKCELCAQSENLSVFEVAPVVAGGADQSVLLCNTCRGQIDNPDTIDLHHWHCLNDSMWSQVPAVQVMACTFSCRIISASEIPNSPVLMAPARVIIIFPPRSR